MFNKSAANRALRWKHSLSETIHFGVWPGMNMSVNQTTTFIQSDEPPRSSTDTVYLPMIDPTPTSESYDMASSGESADTHWCSFNIDRVLPE